MEEREMLGLLLAQGYSLGKIAKQLGRNKSTLSREIDRNGPPINKGYYRAHKAHERSSIRNSTTHKRPRLKNPLIRNYMQTKLKEKWSPEIIANRIRIDIPGQAIGYEAVYQYIYAEQPDLIKFLRRKHKKRKCPGYTRKHSKSHIPDRTPISERPTIIESRKEAGHWEADTAVSRESKTAIAVFIERKTRIVEIEKLTRKTAQHMKDAAIIRLGKYSPDMRRSITFDNGSENTKHMEINEALNTDSYFCAPFHSWEKGSVENVIGLIRWFFPKKTDFSKILREEFQMVQNLLNNRPRKCLNYLTPNEVNAGCCT
jgi:IS30 family transposase